VSHLFVAGNNDIIVEASQILSHATDAFADLSLGAIAIERGAAGLERDSKTEMAHFVRHAKNHALGKFENLILVKETPVLPRMVESTFVTQGLRF
jgi:hypothetical protein